MAQATVEFLANMDIHHGELSIGLSTREDMTETLKWHGVIDAKGVKRTPPNGGWNWTTLFENQLKAPKRYCLSIKWNDCLCGVLLGGISRGKDVVSIHYLETPPKMTPLATKIVQISVTFLAMLGSSVNASYLAIYGPNDAMVERLQNDFGFKQITPYGYRHNDNAPLYRHL